MNLNKYFLIVSIWAIIFPTISACQPSSPTNNVQASLTETKSEPTVRINHHETNIDEIDRSFPREILTDTVVSVDSSPLHELASLQPKIIFQTGTNSANSLNCIEPLNGEIWLIEPPYNDVESILSDSETAYFQPSWSPDGQWITYWQSTFSEIPSEMDHDVLWQYQEDSLWIMRPNGQDRMPITDIIIRSNPTSTYYYPNTCRSTSGILKIIGWSPDSQWVAFIASESSSSQIDPKLFIVNIYTKSIHTFENIHSGHWAKDTNMLIGFDFENSTIILLSTNNIPTILSIAIPDSIKSIHQPTIARYSLIDNVLWVVTKEIDTYPGNRFLWRVDLDTDSWGLEDKISLYERRVLDMSFTNDLAIICRETPTQPDIIEIRNYPSWERITQFFGSCPSHILTSYDENSKLITGYKSEGNKTIQITDLTTFSTIDAFNWENTKFTNQFKVASFDTYFPN